MALINSNYSGGNHSKKLRLFVVFLGVIYEKDARTLCREVALGAVPLSAAGWQQSTAEALKLLPWQMIRAPLWQISISSICLFHFKSPFFQLELYLLFSLSICKVIKLYSVCASIGSPGKKEPSRDLVSHTLEKKINKKKMKKELVL